MSTYRVVRTQNTVYLGPSGNAINGFLVTIEVPDYGEQLQFTVPDLTTKTVKAAADKLVKSRDELAQLGSNQASK